jgi:hypothetical protein
MSKGVRIVLVLIGMCGMAAAQNVCPGYYPQNNTNLACEIATATRSRPEGAETLSSISATLATQLSQLPIAAAASGVGITIGASGLPTVSNEGLGTMLTQRGRTIGRHKLLLSFNYQRFSFQTVDGLSLKSLPLVVDYYPTHTTYIEDSSAVSFRVDQFTALATFGLTNRIDVSFILPFSQVNLATAATVIQHNISYPGGVASDSRVVLYTPATMYLPGTATGIGDVRVNVKANVLGAEGKTSMAVGGEVRFPSGDAINYLGSGAYGFKPYLVISRRGRLTPNVNIGYQWNGGSVLNFGDNLPSSFLYSGGADFRVSKRLTLTGEFLGQYVINAPRLRLTNVTIPAVGSRSTVQSFTGSYAMHNGAVGFKANPFGGLILSASAMFKLDDAGLRSKIVPLFGVAYRF